jgi:hypothetical protein
MARGSVRFVLLAALLAAASAPAHAQTNQPAERFTAFAVNMGGIGGTGAGPIDIVIDRWSSDAERDRLLQTFKEQGPERLLEALRDTKPVGTIRSPHALGWNLRFARQVPDEEGGRRIIIVTDRPIGFAEAAQRPRTMDYPFTVIELRLNREGQGEGRASIAARLSLNERTNTIEIENWDMQPVLLNNVRAAD